MNNSNDRLEKLLDSIYEKISLDLSEDDIRKMEKMDMEDSSGEKVEEFLLSKFPDLFNIVQREVEIFKQNI